MSRELMTLHNYKAYNNGAVIYTIGQDGIYLDGNGGMHSNYLSIDPTNKTYYYDIVVSVDTGNQIYIGWERYDANKTSRSNNACTYCVQLKPSSDLKYARYKGVVNLSTDTVNPCAFIRIRILNKWSHSTSGTTGKMTIHSISLREATSSEIFNQGQIFKNGQFITNTFREKNVQQASISKNGFIDSYEFYEY